jgi:hypothetical protein
MASNFTKTLKINSMEQKDELRKELEELSPFLAKRKGESDGFTVPKYYFHNLPDEILRQVQPTARLEPVRSSGSTWLQNAVQRFWQPRYALAFASLVAIVIATVWLLKPDDLPNAAITSLDVRIEDLPDEAIHHYLSANPDDIENELIIESQYAELEGKPLESVAPKPQTEELEEYLDEVIDEIEVEDLEELL